MVLVSDAQKAAERHDGVGDLPRRLSIMMSSIEPSFSPAVFITLVPSTLSALISVLVSSRAIGS
jgi:hypothetical protein